MYTTLYCARADSRSISTTLHDARPTSSIARKPPRPPRARRRRDVVSSIAAVPQQAGRRASDRDGERHWPGSLACPRCLSRCATTADPRSREDDPWCRPRRRVLHKTVSTASSQFNPSHLALASSRRPPHTLPAATLQLLVVEHALPAEFSHFREPSKV